MRLSPSRVADEEKPPPRVPAAPPPRNPCYRAARGRHGPCPGFAYARTVSRMDDIRVAVTLTTGSLLLRPWVPGDIPALLTAYADPAIRRGSLSPVSSHEDAEAWLAMQQDGWASGSRFGFAVIDTARGDTPAGNVVLKGPGPGADHAEVGYWTAAPARGRGVAPRALASLTDWAFGTFAAQGLTRLELLHQEDNEASCRVAVKSGYAYAERVPALPPQFPVEGHRHVRYAPAA
jgi:RimJ/RimL family protein N-acetyltransferase